MSAMDGFLSWLFGLIAMIVPGFGVSEPPAWNGYVEADYVYLAAPGAGTITAMSAREGEVIEAGAMVFTLDDGQQRTALDGALAQVAAAQPEEAVPGTLLGCQRNQIWRLQKADPTFADIIIALEVAPATAADST